jgi:hypothetical protein
MNRLTNYCLLSALVLLACTFLMPDHFSPWQSFWQEYLAGIALLVAAIGVLVLSDRTRYLHNTTLVVFLVTLIPLAQWALALIADFGDAFLIIIYLLAFALAIAVGYNWQQASYHTDKRSTLIIKPANSLFTLILVCAILSSGIALYQWADLSYMGFLIFDTPQQGGGRVFANLAQPNHLGSLLFMGLVASFYFYHRKYIGPLALSMTAGLLVVGLVLCGSRTVWITAIVSLIWILSKRHLVKGVVRLIVPLLMCILWYLLLILFLIPSLEMFLDPEQLTAIRQAKLLGRSLIWPQMTEAISAGGWWGYGWNQTSIAQVMVGHLGDTAISRTFYSHNLFLDLILWNGPIIGGAIIAVILYWAWRVSFGCNNSTQFYLLWAIGVLAVHSLLEFPFAYAYFLILLGLMLGVVDAANGSMPTLWVLPKRILIAGLVSSIFVLGIVQQEYRALKIELVEAANADLQKDKAMVTSRKRVIFLSQLERSIVLRTEKPREGMTVNELKQMAAAARRSDVASDLNKYAVSLGINGYYHESEKVLKAIYNLYRGRYASICRRWQIDRDKYPQLRNVELPKLIQDVAVPSSDARSKFITSLGGGPCSPNQDTS